ncbi:uncharacterized protein ACMZJ9_013435 isoform 9-T9 [Mantella aurantiaca]
MRYPRMLSVSLMLTLLCLWASDTYAQNTTAGTTSPATTVTGTTSPATTVTGTTSPATTGNHTTSPATTVTGTTRLATTVTAITTGKTTTAGVDSQAEPGPKPEYNGIAFWKVIIITIFVSIGAVLIVFIICFFLSRVFM